MQALREGQFVQQDAEELEEEFGRFSQELLAFLVAWKEYFLQFLAGPNLPISEIRLSDSKVDPPIEYMYITVSQEGIVLFIDAEISKIILHISRSGEVKPSITGRLSKNIYALQWLANQNTDQLEVSDASVSIEDLPKLW